MIELMKTNGSKIVINADLIEEIKETPDTVITLTNGKQLLVKDSSDEIVEKVIEYRQKIMMGISRTGEM